MRRALSTFGLIRRSLLHYGRTNLGVLLGVAISTAVLVGALVVGDSVRMSLRGQAEARIGKITHVMSGGDRFVRSQLADDLSKSGGRDGMGVAPTLYFRGLARNQEQEARAGHVEVLGVDKRFFRFAPQPAGLDAPGKAEAWLNERLARQLKVNLGESLLLRIEKPSLLPRDMAMATIEDISFALRVKVTRILTEDEFGRFGLTASQVPPLNLFVSLQWLQEELDVDGRANVLVARGNLRVEASDNAEQGFAAAVNELVHEHWTLADAQLALADLPNGLVELRSKRIFLDAQVVDAALELEPGLVGVLTYFVNHLKIGKRATPYSMVSAVGPLHGEVTDRSLQALLALAPKEAGGLVANSWLAEDLAAEPGTSLDSEFFVMGPQLQLLEKNRSFTLERIVPIEGAAKDPTLMPEFPGLHDTENCRDWEPGIPIDLDRIRDKDEKYWDKHKGTPKAFLDFATARELFGNRYGSLTSIRMPKETAARLAKSLPKALDPKALGLTFHDIATPALAAGTSATDFGGLFLGLSFFLILAALLLTALLFVFGVEQRANQIGTLLAIGFAPSKVRRLLLTEALILATIGSLLGAALGLGYTKFVLWGLGSLWRDAIGETTLTFFMPPATIATGIAIGIVVALLAIWLTLRKAFDRPAVELLHSKNGIPQQTASDRPKRGRVSAALAAFLPIAAIALLVFASTQSDAQAAAGAFFGAGTLLLVAALALSRRLLVRWAAHASRQLRSVGGLGVRNTGRRVGRSLATVALLASGTFLVVAVQANRLEPPQDPTVRSSGTGGFALFARSTLPVLRDLRTEAGREAFGLTEDDLKDATIVPLRVRDGDDASCLNLSLPQNPRLVGVQAAEFVSRKAFQFGGSLAPEGTEPPDNPWALLDADYGDDVVPAIGDAASITWTLHKSVGDDLDYVDEKGRPFKVRIVGSVTNSVLQGNLVVAEQRLRARFPSASGYRMFLIDAAPGKSELVAANLTRAFEDIGFEVTSTKDRLAAFQAVQNTYLLIFQLLGGLGLLLGSVGVGMVVLRNTLERRSELAVLSAVGYPLRAVRRLVWSEHGVLLGLGLACGLFAALVAVLPATSGGLSLLPMLLLVVGVALSGLLWVWLATLFSTRGTLLDALRAD